MKKHQINYFKSKSRLSGGLIYEQLVADCLSSLYDVRTYDISNTFGPSSRLEKVIRNMFLRKNNAINIRDFISTIDFINSEKQINISVFHHYSPSIHRSIKTVLLDKFLISTYFNNLRKMDSIVVVAEYWKKFLENKGFKNIKLIYNSFDTSKYEVTNAELKQFIHKYNLNNCKQVIYLGPLYGNFKGIQAAYEQLKKFDYHFVATGPKNSNSNIKTLNLNYSEFILLLHRTDLVISLSEFKEGWNRVAHEAVLTGTPVIGSGSGGMRELLENSGQIICEDINKLPEYVSKVFDNYDYYSRIGYNYVKYFDKQYFTNSWDTLIRELLLKKNR